jgi:hypothetical protein
MTRMRLWIILAVLLLAAIAQAGEPADSTIERLAKVDRFAFGGIGFAGITSQGEKDYKLVFSRSSAMADFERMLSIGNPQARSYALVGIRALNPSRYKELLRSFRDSKEEVVTQKGCIELHESLAEVLKHIEAGEYSRGK